MNLVDQWLHNTRCAFVVGSRDFINLNAVDRVLRDLHSKRPDAFIAHTGTPGAPEHAEHYCNFFGKACFVAHSDWQFYGKRTEAARADWVFDYLKPELVIAFLSGNDDKPLPSVLEARRRGIPVYEVLG